VTEEKREELEILIDTIRDVASTLSLPEVLDRLLDRTLRHLESEIGSVLLVEGEGRLRVAASRGLPSGVTRDETVAIGDGVAGYVAATAEPLLVTDIAYDPRFNGRQLERYYTDSLISAPIIFRQRLYGVLNVNNKCSRLEFHSDDLRLLTAIADQAAIAVANARAYEEMQVRAQRDPLTGLANHGHFWSTLTREWKRAERYGRGLSVAMVDIDHFKRFNDSRGHLAGDEVLIAVARSLEEGARTTDRVARYGGDEFAVILPETARQGAAAFGDKVRESISRQGHGSNRDMITVSVGLASYPGSATSPEELVRAADMDLYRAKAEGRNRVGGSSSP